MTAGEGKRVKSARVQEAFADTILKAEQDLEKDLQKIRDLSNERNLSEKAWMTMLIDRRIVGTDTGRKILQGKSPLKR